MKVFFLNILLFVSVALVAQSASEAESLFNNKQYTKAKTMYESLLKKKPNDVLNNYRYARCCYELKEYEDAVKYFELTGNKYPLTGLYLGELYFLTYRFEQSLAAYQAYIETLEPEDKKIAEIQNKLKTVELAAKLINRVEDIAVFDSVVVNKNEFLRYYKFSSELGNVKQERIKLNSKQTVDKVTYTTQRGDRLCYSDSANGNMDIYSSFKLLDEWSKPTSISSVINTKANENYPFLLLDGVTMYFAADGENSIGGYDLFITKYSATSKDFLAPENIGFPFNSFANDYMMVIDEQQRLGWFATDRNQPAGKVMIYKFIPNETKVLFRSEDNDKLHQVARLKVYRKAEKVDAAPIAVIQSETINSDSKINVVINDSTVYTHFEQFQSTIALEKIKEWYQIAEELQKEKKELVDLRFLYGNDDNSEDKTILAGKILQLEKRVIENEKMMYLKLVEAGNEEVKFIDNK